eukprot:154109_1
MPAYHLLKCLLLAVLLFGEPGAHSALVEKTDCEDISAWFKGPNNQMESGQTVTVQFREGVKHNGRETDSNNLYTFMCSDGVWWFMESLIGSTLTEFKKEDYKLPCDLPDSELYVEAGKSKKIYCKDGKYGIDDPDAPVTSRVLSQKPYEVKCYSDGVNFDPKFKPQDCGTLEVVKENAELEWVPLSEHKSQ